MRTRHQHNHRERARDRKTNPLSAHERRKGGEGGHISRDEQRDGIGESGKAGDIKGKPVPEQRVLQEGNRKTEERVRCGGQVELAIF